MPKRTYIQRLVNLDQTDYWTVRQYADDKGLGGKGFSAALRMIVREWRELKKLDPALSLSNEEAAAAINDALRQAISELLDPPYIRVTSPAPRDDSP